MNTYISDDEQTNAVIKTHPWTETEDYPADRYYDFKANPTLIPQVLDNFKGWSDWSEWEGVQLFYSTNYWDGSTARTRGLSLTVADFAARAKIRRKMVGLEN